METQGDKARTRSAQRAAPCSRALGDSAGWHAPASGQEAPACQAPRPVRRKDSKAPVPAWGGPRRTCVMMASSPLAPQA